MTPPRIDPVGHVFGTLAGERFPAITATMGVRRDLDQFLMVESAIALLDDLRPEGGLGDAIDPFVSFVHAAWAWWADGSVIRRLDADATANLLAGHRPTGTTPGSAMYIQVEPRRIWARIGTADLHEPLDGWFSLPDGNARRVVACLGLHAARPGLSVLVAWGACPVVCQRDDGTPQFAPRMEGGGEAGLASIDSTDELLWLAWSLPVP